MSSPDVVEVWPEHDGDIRAQLDAAVRALLIDTYYWPPLASPEQLVAAGELMTSELAARIVAALQPSAEGREGTFLCHIHCVFGGMPLLTALEDIGAFLDANPVEVVTLIIQDAISPADTAAAFAAAGLEDRVYTGPTTAPWPTLGELVDEDRRLVVFAEDQGPPLDWHHHAFTSIQETPFLVVEPSRFSCRANRGQLDATLFLMNHWVQRIAQSRVDATTVNAHDVIVDRAMQCRRERGLPHYIAVNFYSIGDLMASVDTLNGVA